ncbi:hypothetical protein DUI87_19566 [Hirundo rustica rustica]|uniref:Uncharacterized protein n=1 Tax=Hirundo rustica rustica TaxID=333673 RepID=A0A3M0JRX7_HIRRU|nr:hypothetical protein DUI87_19566 [Hirundo rustica rustica]
MPGSLLPARRSPLSLCGSGSIVPAAPAAPQQQAGRGESGPRESAPLPLPPPPWAGAGATTTPTTHAQSSPPFSAVPKETPVDQEMGTRDPCCRPPSPDNVPLLDELEEDPSDGAEPLAEPTIGLKELTDQIQAMMQRLDKRAQAATKLLLEKAQELSTINAKNQEEPTSFSSQLTPMQQLLEQTAESNSQATPLPAPPVTQWSKIIDDAILEGQWEPTGHMACPVACPVVFRDGNPLCAVGKNGSTLAGTSVLPPFLHIGSMIALAAMIYRISTLQLLERHLCLYILTFGFVSAKITNQLVVAHITKSEMSNSRQSNEHIEADGMLDKIRIECD